jgi:hypothetical protein
MAGHPGLGVVILLWSVLSAGCFIASDQMATDMYYSLALGFGGCVLTFALTFSLGGYSSSIVSCGLRTLEAFGILITIGAVGLGGYGLYNQAENNRFCFTANFLPCATGYMYGAGAGVLVGGMMMAILIFVNEHQSAIVQQSYVLLPISSPPGVTLQTVI